MINKLKVATKTSTKTFVALLVMAGVLTIAAAFAMITVPTSPFLKEGRLIKPGYVSSGYTAPGYVTPGYFSFRSPGYLVPGYVAPGYQAPSSVALVEENNYDVLLFSMTNLTKVSGLEEKISEFISTLETTENLRAEYWELDSSEFESNFGYKVEDPSNWEEIRDVLERVEGDRSYKYFVILGGVDIVPYIIKNDVPNGDETFDDDVEGDLLYADFDNDYIPDENIIVSRIPDYGTDSTTIYSYLDTAIEMHGLGGVSFDTQVVFGEGEGYYLAPPYCVLYTYLWEGEEDCNLEETVALISGADYLMFFGHGSPNLIQTDNRKYNVFQINYFDSFDLQTNHPFVNILYPCQAGPLGDDEDYWRDSNFAVEFLKSGASIYTAKIGEDGIFTTFGENFPLIGMSDGSSVGEAFYEGIRYALLVDGAYGSPSGDYTVSSRLLLYGDPTLKLR